MATWIASATGQSSREDAQKSRWAGHGDGTHRDGAQGPIRSCIRALPSLTGCELDNVQTELGSTQSTWGPDLFSRGKGVSPTSLHRAMGQGRWEQTPGFLEHSSHLDEG